MSNLPVLVPTPSAARANWGRWISRCSRCPNAWRLDPGQSAWQCATCGTVNEAQWPADPAAVEYLLMLRPEFKTRNWEPTETIEDLLRQNAEHGHLPPEVVELTSAPAGSHLLLDIVDQRATDGILLAPIQMIRNAIAATGRSPLEELTNRQDGHLPLAELTAGVS
jgi:hypothetical protein